MGKPNIAHLLQDDNLIIMDLDDPRFKEEMPDWWEMGKAIARGRELERKFDLARAGNLDLSDMEEL